MKMFAKAPLPEVAKIRERLEYIFPEGGVSDRNYVVREMAARTVFTMLYVDAVEGQDVWLAPRHVYWMTDEQSRLQAIEDRKTFYNTSSYKKLKFQNNFWYADNTREPVRDETLREGFVAKGAVITLSGVPTTSSKGRYALQRDFAMLFMHSDYDFKEAANEWSNKHLSKAEQARLQIARSRISEAGSVTVTFPGGSSRTMSPGLSSEITKAVIEEFSLKYLFQPAVLWVSESGSKVVLEGDKLMQSLHIPIDQKTLLPDLVLADLDKDNFLLIFVEVVATDGPVTDKRKEELLKLIDDAGYKRENVAFMTAFEDRNSPPLKRRLSGIATDSMIWCLTEPELIIWLGQKSKFPLKFKGSKPFPTNDA